MPSIIVWLVFSCSVVELVNCECTNVVKTNYGLVRGKTEKTRLRNETFLMYLGIPFAKPPVEKLRFRASQPPESWSGVLNATEERSVCPQFDYFNKYHGDEDCLYLNVYSPIIHTKRPKLLSVAVYIYGGAFVGGSKDRDLYGPDYMIEQGILVVVPNYRLGALGFICTPGLECNCGLKDQNLALKWVQKNIRYFGGNPNDVTLIGQSAGGISAQLQMLSPMGKGLFHRVMIQSGSSLCVWGYQSPNEAESYAQKLADNIAGYPVPKSKIAAVLNSATAKELVVGTRETSTFTPHFRPTREVRNEGNEIFLPDCPLNIMTSGRFQRRPVIMGFTKDEAISFADGITILEDYLDAVTHNLTDSSNVISRIAGNVVQKITDHISNFTTEELVNLATDLLFVSCIDLTQRIFTKILNENVYYYYFDYAGPLNVHRDVYGVNLNGVGHGDDIGVEFYVKPLHPFPENESLSSQMNQVAYNFTCLITNFVKTGNPTPPHRMCSEDEWPDSREHGNMMNISTSLTVVPRQVNETAERNERLLYTYLKYFNGCSC